MVGLGQVAKAFDNTPGSSKHIAGCVFRLYMQEIARPLVEGETLTLAGDVEQRFGDIHLCQTLLIQDATLPRLLFGLKDTPTR